MEDERHGSRRERTAAACQRMDEEAAVADGAAAARSKMMEAEVRMAEVCVC